MYRRPRNRVARDIAERFIMRRLVRQFPGDFADRLITRRLVRMLMIESEYLSGLANRPRCWLLGHDGPKRLGYIRCTHCGQKVRPARS